LSQNHLGWKGPLKIIYSDALLKQGQLEQVAQNHIQLGFECLQGWRLALLWATWTSVQPPSS